MPPTTENQSIVGRGAREGAALLREWFGELNQAAEADRPAAYVFVMGSIVEILRSFDLPIVFPEIHSLQTAVRQVAHEFLDEAEDYGYSPDICGYVKADVAVQLRRGGHPAGRIPRPALGVHTNACNTYIKWAEIWERMYAAPAFTLDVPGPRSADDRIASGSSDFERDRRYVEGQLRELIRVCEGLTGRTLDLDRVRSVMARCNDIGRYWKRVLELNAGSPAVFDALTDGTIYLGVANALRGTEAASRYFARLVEELEYKREHGIGTTTDEEWRLAFVGVPCYPIFRRFAEMFSEWGGVFVASTYLWFASGGANVGFQYDLERPIESLAEGVLLSVRDAMDSLFHHDRILLQMVEQAGVDGVVYHPIKSCRTVSTGLADGRRALREQSDVASLFIESDMMDRRVVSEAQLKNRVDAFFEGLASRRRRVEAAR